MVPFAIYPFTTTTTSITFTILTSFKVIKCFVSFWSERNSKADVDGNYQHTHIVFVMQSGALLGLAYCALPPAAPYYRIEKWYGFKISVYNADRYNYFVSMTIFIRFFSPFFTLQCRCNVPKASHHHQHGYNYVDNFMMQTLFVLLQKTVSIETFLMLRLTKLLLLLLMPLR